MKKILAFALVAMMAVSAMAQEGVTYGWWDSSITIAGTQYDFTGWSSDPMNGTNLGTIDLVSSMFVISAASGNIWSQAQDRGGLNLFFNTYVNATPDAVGHDWWVGSVTGVGGNDYTFDNNVGVTLGTVTLQAGDVVGIDFWAKTYGTSGDEWYSAGGNNYHAYFTVGAAPVPEPATMSLLGLGALAMVLRRKMSK